MKNQGMHRGFTGLMPRWLDAALWLLAAGCVGALAFWSLPRQLEYMVFLAGLAVLLFLLAVIRPVWSQCLFVALLPGITTASLTVTNPLNRYLSTVVLNKPGRMVTVGVFDAAALFLALGFVLGVWLRALVRREEAAPNRMRVPVLAFMGLSVISAAVSVWRYVDFWPLANYPYCDQVVNVTGMGGAAALTMIVWTTVNYLTGPLVMLAVCHVAWHMRLKEPQPLSAPAWIMAFIVAPLLVGAIVPICAGLHQVLNNVWFGANKTYIWPWLRRINATFFDPNALGSFILLFVPWLCAALGYSAMRVKWRWAVLLPLALAVPSAWLLQDRFEAALSLLPDTVLRWTWLVKPAWLLTLGLKTRLAIAGSLWAAAALASVALRHWRMLIGLVTGLATAVLLGVSMKLAMHAGSRTAIVGVLCIGAISLLFVVVGLVRRVQGHVPPWLYRLAMASVIVVYCAAGVWLFYRGLPRIRARLVGNPRTASVPLVKRIEKMPLGDWGAVYRQIMADRGPYARIALYMTRDLPLTGVGIGCFVTELPNWKRKTGITIYVPDTACNYYLQVAAEQGAIGLVAACAVFWVWWTQWWRVMRERRERSFWTFVGAGMAGMMLMFIFGMHTLAHEIGCLFWIFAAQPFIAGAADDEARPRLRYVWLVVLIVAGLYLSTALTQLSLGAQRERFGWAKREGFFNIEQWKGAGGSLKIRHTRQRATDMVVANGLVFRQTWACLHPDITAQPVRVTFSLGDTATNVVVADNEWHTWAMPVSWDKLRTPLRYELATDRPWTGSDRGITGDWRQIGVTLQENRSWADSVGMFDQETWGTDGGLMSGLPYRWSSAAGQTVVRGVQSYLRVPVLVAHPDVTSSPVVVSFSINGSVVTNIERSDIGWRAETLFLRGGACSNLMGDTLCLGVSVNRTWCPASQGLPDSRELGVGIGRTEPLQDMGFYARETWASPKFGYKWAGQAARWTQRADSCGAMSVQYLVAHPDLSNQAVRLDLRVNGMPACAEVVSNAIWRSVDLQGTPDVWNEIEACVDRTWQPREYGLNDDRTLGFAIKF